MNVFYTWSDHDRNTSIADSDDYGWTFTTSGNQYTIQNNGTYLGRSSSKLAAGSSSSTDSSDVSISSTRLKVGSYYLRYSSGKIAANSSAGSSYIFVEE